MQRTSSFLEYFKIIFALTFYNFHVVIMLCIILPIQTRYLVTSNNAGVLRERIMYMKCG